MRSMPRNACVIQITPVRLTRTSANDASGVRKIYLSIDPIVTVRSHLAGLNCGCDQTLKPGSPLVAPPFVQPPHSLTTIPTKWLSQGTLAIWLIIRPMWPSGHGSAWQYGAEQAIVLRNTLLTDVQRSRKRTFEAPPRRVTDPCDSPDFGGFAYDRRRQGRLRPVFHRPQGHSGGFLRRYVEARHGHPQAAGECGRSGQARRRDQSFQGQKRLDARYSGARGSQGLAPD